MVAPSPTAPRLEPQELHPFGGVSPATAVIWTGTATA